MDPMTDRSRIAITVVTTLALGASTYGHAFEVDPPGVLRDIWYGDLEAILFGLAIFGVFLVYRWWALLPAIAPAAVTVYLHHMTDYVYPFHEDFYENFSANPLLLVLFAIVWIGLLAAILSIGLLLRALWEAVRARRRGGPLTGST